ncbi:MAG: penicillin-binding protein 2 [Rhodospirillaceae bacterium]|nr:penicillin-binding protein 2 [Rhodospirillaceae bacterium]
MQSDLGQSKTFSRRTILLGGGQFILFSALAGRMYYLQVLESDRYAMLADENRISLRLLPPPRGRILDRYGVPLAVNQLNYRAVIVPEQVRDLESTLDALNGLIPLSERDRRRVRREIGRKRRFLPVTVRDNLSWEDVSRIEVNAPDLPGVAIDVGQSRSYPFGGDAGHVVGYVAPVSPEEQGRKDPLLELPDFRIGKSGVEKNYDLDLRGSAGTSQIEVNALGRVIRELEREEGQPGHEIVLSIDAELQRYVTSRLKGESASVVVMDAYSGEILALVSSPGFDPNAFNKGLSESDWQELITNVKSPLTNKAHSGQYAPGSTFKMVVALAALEDGIVTPEQRFFCPGYVELGDSKFHCWKKDGHGYVDMVGGLEHSCDVYFYELSRRTGIDRIAEMAQRLGFGASSGIDLPNGRDGLVPSRAWKEAVFGGSWQQGETLLTGIGQGYVLATPLQLAVMIARLVNGGREVKPHLTLDSISDGQSKDRLTTDLPDLGFSPEALSILKQGMDAVSNSPRGTAYRSRIHSKGMEMGGKTGTAQVRRISKSERLQGVRKNEEIPWKERDHALFVGYAPVDDPRFVISVVVEHGGSGSKIAAPIARDVMTMTQRRAQKITPVSIAGK